MQNVKVCSMADSMCTITLIQTAISLNFVCYPFDSITSVYFFQEMQCFIKIRIFLKMSLLHILPSSTNWPSHKPASHAGLHPPAW